MSAEYSITRYARADQAAVFELVRRVYSPPSAQLLTRQWDWKYEHNPLMGALGPNIYLMWDKNKLVGMLGAIPLCVSIHGAQFPITHSCDLMLDPAYRGKRLSERLLDRYMNENPLSFGWTTVSSHRRVQHINRSNSRLLTPLIRVLKPLVLLSQLARQRSLQYSSSPMPSPAKEDEPILAAESSGRVEITEIRAFDQAFDSLWERARRAYPVLLVRNAQYLNWRYVLRPDVSYTILKATWARELVGYLVLRLVEYQTLRVGYFVDMFVDRARSPAVQALLRAGIRYLQARGAAAVQYTNASSIWNTALYRHGFFPRYGGSRYRFHVRAERNAPARVTFRDPTQWYLLAGDGDLEMSF